MKQRYTPYTIEQFRWLYLICSVLLLWGGEQICQANVSSSHWSLVKNALIKERGCNLALRGIVFDILGRDPVGDERPLIDGLVSEYANFENEWARPPYAKEENGHVLTGVFQSPTHRYELRSYLFNGEALSFDLIDSRLGTRTHHSIEKHFCFNHTNFRFGLDLLPENMVSRQSVGQGSMGFISQVLFDEANKRLILTTNMGVVIGFDISVREFKVAQADPRYMLMNMAVSPDHKFTVLVEHPFGMFVLSPRITIVKGSVFSFFDYLAEQAIWSLTQSMPPGFSIEHPEWESFLWNDLARREFRWTLNFPTESPLSRLSPAAFRSWIKRAPLFTAYSLLVAEVKDSQGKRETRVPAEIRFTPDSRLAILHFRNAHKSRALEFDLLEGTSRLRID